MADRKRPRTSRLSARDWADAALDAIRDGGLAAVAVEPLAARLGTTKGSFYWHFSGRDALVTAALERWEERETEAVILEIGEAGTPGERLRRLFRITTAAAARESGPIELALLADAGHPAVAAAVRRVTGRRIAYLVDLFAEHGCPPAEARQRALLAYTGYLGHAQLARSVPGALPRDEEAADYVESVLRALLSGGRREP
ncbi:TetR/AcrR family transcriptional regulator [Streptomyces aidingensis]|uniref:DNA-binding transcriptional regulator, AcrR family n=1 Tax=Streptomyces aidingensis TaxID=910347 RepID=A0A1I1N3X3_9ACTN|nr:TetR/AcrR family transcriptional regulator [Streptomyces aidingensis]SFC90178.1 DNA-binding transcriptional regulator, AcrR family [Streptomyces aidingensis]